MQKLLKVISIRLLVNHIKHGLRAEPTSTLASNSTVGVSRLFRANLYWLLATRGSRSFSHQLRLTALLKADEPENSLLNGLANSKKAVVLQKRSLLVTKTLGNIFTLLLSEHDSVKRVVDDVVIVESTRVLSKSVDLAAQRTPCATIDRMAVSSTIYIRTGGMNCAVNHVRCGVEQAALASIDHFARMVDQDEIRLVDQRERDTKWVNPKALRVDRISEGDVASDTLVKAVLSEDSKGGCEAALQVLSLLVLVFKLGGSEEGESV